MPIRASCRRSSARFTDALRKRTDLTGINSFFRPTVPQLFVDVDQEKASALGVPVNTIFDALQATMGPLYVNDFNRSGRTFRVQIQADAAYRDQPEDIGNIYVRSAAGDMLPVKSVIKVERVVGPEQIDRYNGFIAAKVIGNGAPGVSSGQAIATVEEVAAATLPPGYTIEWTGQAFQEKRIGTTAVFAFVFAIIMVFLILSANYERWALPVAVLLAVPFGMLGALMFVWLRGFSNDIYFQIGLLVLIGLAAKNAILIVEFAAQKQADGLSAADAAIEASRLRFRPIVMTSLAFILGTLPLALATRRGRRLAAIDGHGRGGRHDHRDVRRDALHPDVLHAARASAPQACGRGAAARAGGGADVTRALLALLACASLAGCMVGPDYRRPDVTLPGQFPGSGPEAARGCYGRRASRMVASSITTRCSTTWSAKRSRAMPISRRPWRGSTKREPCCAPPTPRSSRSSTWARKAGRQALTNVNPTPRVITGYGFSVSTSYEIDFWGRLQRSAESARSSLLASPLRARRRRAVAHERDHASLFHAARARCADRRDAREPGELRRARWISRAGARRAASSRISICARPKGSGSLRASSSPISFASAPRRCISSRC